MSKLRKPLVKQPSHMFDGESISKQLQNSSVGGFQKAMQDIKPLLPTVVFKLPTVIVMGGKSAGKSSLLENITKCPVFPRDPALCTKMPVKLQLVQAPSEQDCSVIVNWRGVSVLLDSKDDILAEVAKIMDSVDRIVTDEVTVTICQVIVTDLLHFEQKLQSFKQYLFRYMQCTCGFMLLQNATLHLACTCCSALLTRRSMSPPSSW